MIVMKDKQALLILPLLLLLSHAYAEKAENSLSLSRASRQKYTSNVFETCQDRTYLLNQSITATR